MSLIRNILFRLFYNSKSFTNKSNTTFTFKKYLDWYSKDNYCQKCVKETSNGYNLEYNGKEVIIYSNESIKHGVISVDIKIPKMNCIWAAFWLFGDNGMPEYDFEWFDNDQHLVVTSHWGYDYKEGRKKNTHFGRRINKHYNPNKFNNYSFELTPYEVIFRVNGFIVQKMKKGISTNQQHLIISMGKKKNCNKTKLKGIMEIKNIKINKIL